MLSFVALARKGNWPAKSLLEPMRRNGAIDRTAKQRHDLERTSDRFCNSAEHHQVIGKVTEILRSDKICEPHSLHDRDPALATSVSLQSR